MLCWVVSLRDSGSIWKWRAEDGQETEIESSQGAQRVSKKWKGNENIDVSGKQLVCGISVAHSKIWLMKPLTKQDYDEGLRIEDDNMENKEQQRDL